MALRKKNIPVLQADSYASLQVVSLVANIFDEDSNELAFNEENDADKYFDELDQLTQDILDAENRARIGRFGIEVTTAIPLKVAEMGSVAAPLPASIFLKITQKKIEYAKSIILDQIDQSLEKTSDALAASAAKVFVENTGKSTDELFNAVPPDVAADNIQKAAQALVDGYDGISDRQKKILLGAAVSGMRKLVKDSAVTTSTSEMSKQQAIQATEKIELSKETAKKIIDNEEKLSEAGKELTEKQLSSENELKTKGDLSADTRKSLISTANTVIQYAKLANEVVDAAETLGLNPKIGSAIKRVSGAVQGAATAAIGIATGNPIAIISGVASFVSSIFGKKKKGPNLAVYLNKIFEKLGEIENTLDRIEATQRTILDNQRIISLNQIKLAKISGDIVREIQKNRDFLVEISYGPIKLFEEDLAEAGLLGATGGGYPVEMSYQEYYQKFGVFHSDIAIQALSQLDKLFGTGGFIHPVLRSSSYLPTDQVKLQVGKGPDTLFQLDVGQGKDLMQLFKKRLSRLAKIGTPRSAITEGSSIGQMFFQSNEHLPESEGLDELNTDLIDPGTLIRLGNIAVASNTINELLVTDGSQNRRMMTIDELTTRKTSPRGFELLETVLELVDVTIGQQLILSDEYFKLEFLMSVLRGEKSVEDESEYLAFDPELKTLWSVAIAYASLGSGDGLYSLKWMDHDQIDLAEFVIENPYFEFRGHPGDQFGSNNWTGDQFSNWEFSQERAIDDIQHKLPGKMQQLIEFKVDARLGNYQNPDPMGLSDIVHVKADLFGYEFSVLGDKSISSLDQYCGVWSRAEKNAGIIKLMSEDGDQLPYDDLSNYFGKIAPPPSWSKWDIEKMKTVNVAPNSINLQEFELFRTAEELRFDPMIEQLISLKSNIQRALLTYHIKQNGQNRLKERILDAMLPVEA